MRTVSFFNDGLIDPRAYSLIGASAKNAGAIGYFGTGLKYAIAVVLRLGGKIEIWRGTDECIEFRALPTEMRGEEFDVVHANDQELAYTTELGKNWKPWQAFRELWCNAMDEGGDLMLGEKDPEEGITVVRVTHPDFVEQYHKREDIVLFSTPQWISSGVEITERSSKNIYYRSIRIAEQERESRYTYNIVGHAMQLTEDRTLRWPWDAMNKVRDAVMSSTDEEFIKGFLTTKFGGFESHLPLNDGEPSEAFLRVMESLNWKEITNASALTVFKKATGKLRKPKVKPTSDQERKMVAEACRVIAPLGIEIEPEHVHVTDELEDNTLGLSYGGEMWIARRTFSRGQRMVTGTIYEEALHALHGYADESRDMQNYLIDKLIELAEDNVS